MFPGISSEITNCPGPDDSLDFPRLFTHVLGGRSYQVHGWFNGRRRPPTLLFVATR